MTFVWLFISLIEERNCRRQTKKKKRKIFILRNKMTHCNIQENIVIRQQELINTGHRNLWNAKQTIFIFMLYAKIRFAKSVGISNFFWCLYWLYLYKPKECFILFTIKLCIFVCNCKVLSTKFKSFKIVQNFKTASYYIVSVA